MELCDTTVPSGPLLYSGIFQHSDDASRRIIYLRTYL